MKRLVLSFCLALAVMFAFSVVASAQSRPHGGSGGGGGGQAAAPRGGSGGGGGSHATSGPPPQSTGSARPRGESSGSGGSVSQGSARPTGGRPLYGSASPRGSVPGNRFIYVPSRYYGLSPWFYYSPYAYGAFGLGFWGYDPYWWGYPYAGYGWGYPYYGGYGGYGYGGYGYGGYGYDYGYRDRAYDRGYGSIKLKVKPKEAEVYVDGYYMGQVNDFDGAFQHLDVEGGTHRIEIRANGYQPLVLEMNIEPGRTVTYERNLQPVQEGAPVR